MGLDAEILIKGDITDDALAGLNDALWGRWIAERPLWRDGKEINVFVKVDGGARFDSIWRYWGPGYERGPWPYIHAVLRLASTLGLPVLYGHDCQEEEDYVTWAPEWEQEYWVHYVGSDGDAYYSN